MKYIFLSKIHLFLYFLFNIHFQDLAISFPSIPSYSGSISGWLKSFLVFLGEVVLYPFEYIIYAIGSGVGSGLQGLFSSLFDMASSTYTSSEKSFSFAGPLAPILVSAVWGVSFIIIIFFILMAIHLIWGDVQDNTGD